jgi:hypothetical protein
MRSTAQTLPRNNADSLSALELLDREDLVKLVKSMLSNGVALTFYGKRWKTAWSARWTRGPRKGARSRPS